MPALFYISDSAFHSTDTTKMQIEVLWLSGNALDVAIFDRYVIASTFSSTNVEVRDANEEVNCTTHQGHFSLLTKSA